jgi:methylated-DNA-[protein]-cysteine S-methyltransferase
MAALYRRTLSGTPFGDVTVLWSEFSGEPRIVRVFLPGTKEWMPAGSVPGSCDAVLQVCRGIEALLSGEAAVLDMAVLRMEVCTPFQRTVLQTESLIPRGEVSTYGLIARETGNRRRARAVGSALARNPFPLVVPCHRAVRSDGRAGGYQGGTAMKRRLLEMEGIGFDGRGRVTAGRFWFD